MFPGLYCKMSEEQLHTAVAGPLNVMDVPSTISVPEVESVLESNTNMSSKEQRGRERMLELNLAASSARYSEAHSGLMLLSALNLTLNSSKKSGRLDCSGREHVE